MTDAINETVARVKAYLDNAPEAGPWPLDADLRTLLAAYAQTVRERDRYRAAAMDVLFTFHDWPAHTSSYANGERRRALNTLATTLKGEEA